MRPMLRPVVPVTPSSLEDTLVNITPVSGEEDQSITLFLQNQFPTTTNTTSTSQDECSSSGIIVAALAFIIGLR
ncbi:hypothetical protein Q7C36_007549 [Tachysurus vachellii]|uniref:Uncharacterized protein n=1 Tax=Tachysurus vachellii TaxID=175792 RepID=A0AA88N5N4_TACVA|nr:hypothetical protein Q7C36_007549 [Tachysurus vachellii]